MLYLGIDQHSKQLTVCVREESGQIVQRKQVATRGGAVDEFLEQLRQRSGDVGYAAIVEVCGFNDWLLDLLPERGGRHVVAGGRDAAADDGDLAHADAGRSVPGGRRAAGDDDRGADRRLNRIDTGRRTENRKAFLEGEEFSIEHSSWRTNRHSIDSRCRTLCLLVRTETRPGRAVRGAPWCSEHVNLIGTPPAVETVAQTPGVRRLKRRRSRAHSPARNHEGMDRGAVGRKAQERPTRTRCTDRDDDDLMTQPKPEPNTPAPQHHRAPGDPGNDRAHTPLTTKPLSGRGTPRSHGTPSGAWLRVGSQAGSLGTRMQEAGGSGPTGMARQRTPGSGTRWNGPSGGGGCFQLAGRSQTRCSSRSAQIATRVMRARA